MTTLQISYLVIGLVIGLVVGFLGGFMVGDETMKKYITSEKLQDHEKKADQ